MKPAAPVTRSFTRRKGSDPETTRPAGAGRVWRSGEPPRKRLTLVIQAITTRPRPNPFRRSYAEGAGLEPDPRLVGHSECQSLEDTRLLRPPVGHTSSEIRPKSPRRSNNTLR